MYMGGRGEEIALRCPRCLICTLYSVHSVLYAHMYILCRTAFVAARGGWDCGGLLALRDSGFTEHDCGSVGAPVEDGPWDSGAG